MSEQDMAKRIKDLRTSQGMTLEQVAEKVGVGKSTVRKWETGLIANMRRDKIAALADALNTSPMYLMGWSDEINPAPALDLSKFDNIYPVKLKNSRCWVKSPAANLSLLMRTEKAIFQPALTSTPTSACVPKVTA